MWEGMGCEEEGEGVGRVGKRRWKGKGEEGNGKKEKKDKGRKSRTGKGEERGKEVRRRGREK